MTPLQRIYRLNAQGLKPIRDWVKAYERTWESAFRRLDVVLGELKQQEGDDGGDGE